MEQKYGKKQEIAMKVTGARKPSLAYQDSPENDSVPPYNELNSTPVASWVCLLRQRGARLGLQTLKASKGHGGLSLVHSQPSQLLWQPAGSQRPKRLPPPPALPITMPQSCI